MSNIMFGLQTFYDFEIIRLNKARQRFSPERIDERKGCNKFEYDFC